MALAMAGGVGLDGLWKSVQLMGWLYNTVNILMPGTVFKWTVILADTSIFSYAIIDNEIIDIFIGISS